MSMYKIFANGVEIDGNVLSPMLTVEANKAGSLTFTLPPGHPQYGSMNKLKTIITVTQSGEEIFRGRVLDDVRDFYNRKEITVEGELAFLNDSLQLPFQYEGKLKGLLQRYISNHNAMVEEEKRFTLGTMTVTNADVKAETGDYSNTLELISEVVESYGGYFIPRLKNGVRYIDYVKDYVKQSGQRIEFAVNMLDLNELISAESICTVIYPLTKDSHGNTVTIEDVNGGAAYLENTAGIAQYGRIVRKVELDAADAADLLVMAQKYLELHSTMINTITIGAVDMHHVNVDAEKLRVGDSIRVVSAPHGLDKYFTCTRIEYNLSDPSKNTYTLGIDNSSMLDQQISSTAAIKKTSVKNVSMLKGIISNTVEGLNGQWSTTLEQTAEHIKAEAHNETLGLQSQLEQTAGQIRTEVQDTKEGLESNISQTAESIQAQVTALDGRMGTMELSADGFRTSITGLDGRASTLEQTAESLSSSITGLDGRASSLEQTAVQIRSEVSDTKDELESSIQQNADIIRLTLENASETLASFELKQNRMFTQINGIDGRVGTMELRADRFEVAIGQDGLGGKIELLEGLLDLQVQAGGNTVSVKLDAMDDSISLKANKTYVDKLVADEIEAVNGKFTQLTSGLMHATALSTNGLSTGYLQIGDTGVGIHSLTVGSNSWNIVGTQDINFSIADTQEYKNGVSAATSEGYTDGYTKGFDTGAAGAFLNKTSDVSLGYGESVTVTAKYYDHNGGAHDTSKSITITSPAQPATVNVESITCTNVAPNTFNVGVTLSNGKTSSQSFTISVGQ